MHNETITVSIEPSKSNHAAEAATPSTPRAVIAEVPKKLKSNKAPVEEAAETKVEKDTQDSGFITIAIVLGVVAAAAAVGYLAFARRH